MRAATKLGGLFLAVAFLSGCGDGQSGWGDASEMTDEPIDGTVVADAERYRVVEGTDDRGEACAQLTVEGVTMPCNHYGMGRGGHVSMALRSGDTRFIEALTDPTTREVIVWSTFSPSGRSVAPLVAADNAILVWIMEPGEEPWGAQAIGPDGELEFTLGFVGLSGD